MVEIWVLPLILIIGQKTYLDILVLGKGPTQGLEHTLTAEKMYSINFIATKKKLTEQIVNFFLMTQKFINLKQKTVKL